MMMGNVYFTALISVLTALVTACFIALVVFFFAWLYDKLIYSPLRTFVPIVSVIVLLGIIYLLVLFSLMFR